MDDDEYGDIVEHMETLGWTRGPDGTVTGPEGQTFPDWVQAIKACIDVASGA